MDYMVRAIAADGQIRAFAATTKELTEKAHELHQTSPVVSAALGRLMTGAVMMGSMMKNEKDLLTLQIHGDGPVHGLTVTADSRGNVKGLADVPDAILPPNPQGKLDVGGIIGAGSLSVVKDLGLKEPYHSQVPLQTGEIGDDLTYYFALSEQVPSAVGLGVLVDKEDYSIAQAGGFIIQLMPFAEEETISALEKSLAEVSSVTALLREGYTPEMILEKLLGGLGLELTDKMPVQFYCGCSRERIRNAIRSIQVSELEEMAEEGEPIEVKCHFCNAAYVFEPEEIKEMLKERQEKKS